MDGFPAGVGQSCQLYPPSIPPSSVALDLAPGALLEGYRGAALGDWGYFLCFLTPMERIPWGIVAVGQREGAGSSVGGDRDRVTGCQCHSARDRAEGYQRCSCGGGKRDAASISPALWRGFPGKWWLWASGKEQCRGQGQGDRALAVSLCPQYSW